MKIRPPPPTLGSQGLYVTLQLKIDFLIHYNNNNNNNWFICQVMRYPDDRILQAQCNDKFYHPVYL